MAPGETASIKYDLIDSFPSVVTRGFLPSKNDNDATAAVGRLQRCIVIFKSFRTNGT